MTFATLLAVAEEAETHGNIALETIGFPIIALVVFFVLAMVALSYRNVANRHSPKAEAYARTHAEELTRAGHGHH